MKIGFFNIAPLVYDVSTPYTKPLGGTESAMCYLSVELAKRGHEVVIYGRYKESFKLKGVLHKPQTYLEKLPSEKLDFLINQTDTDILQYIKKSGGKTKIVLWEHLTHNQPAVFSLSVSEVKDAANCYVFVSNWQKKEFQKKFDLDPKKCKVIKNAISPFFENIYKQKESILKYKKPILAYTSTPFRGLESLLVMFPEIKRKNPEVLLKVFSGMSVYQKSLEDKQKYQHLYDICEKTPGIKYVGAVSQERLAEELKSAILLTYPSIWAETSCISVMEAMAAGCKVATTEIAALPETTEGFAHLTPLNNNFKKNRDSFIEFILDTLKRLNKKDKSLNNELIKQVKFYNAGYTWRKRAAEWEDLLSSLA